MTDTPGWASPGSPEPAGEEAEPRDAAVPDRPSPTPAEEEPRDAAPPPPAPGGPEGAAPAPAPGPGTAPAPAGPPLAGTGTGWVAPPPPGPGHGPYPPPGPGGPGWGGQGPAGGWGWQQPWVPKPGVIPLRPLGVGEVLDGAVSTLRTYWRTVLGISVVVAVLTQVVVQTLTWWLERGLGDQVRALQDNGGAPDVHQIARLYAEVFSTAGVSGIVVLLSTIVATALLTMVVGRAVLGRPTPLGEVWSDARPRLLRLLGLTLLTALIGAGVIIVAFLPGFIAAVSGAPGVLVGVMFAVPLLAGLIVFIWLMVLLSLAPPVLMLEKQGIGASLRRSVKLVRGSWWRIFLISVLAWLLVTIIGGMIQVPFAVVAVVLNGGSGGFLNSNPGNVTLGGLAITGLGAAISATLTMPISAAVRVLLYIDQRIRREALDIELARAAGLPGYGAPAGAGV